MLLTGTSDSIFKGRRYPAIIFGGTVNIIVCISLAIWDIPVGWKWACFILAGCSGGLSGLCMAYVSFPFPSLAIHILPKADSTKMGS